MLYPTTYQQVLATKTLQHILTHPEQMGKSFVLVAISYICKPYTYLCAILFLKK
jgi:hypothetical protein